MAIEVFALLNNIGESCAEDHIFTGRKQDFNNLSKWLAEQYEINKRKKKVLKLSELFLDKSKTEEPYIRLNQKDSKEFHQALKSLSENKRSAPLKKVVGILNESLWLY
ncbi:hypothetical protein [Pseudoalteromonas sp. GutCa3]|uniref:hypothetical protein n=1 Tax=Pseudoalteromonas sp. GutCa3 TaxID=888433 RepID=UPI000C33B866|nr:hypothetical protein [Pseudoalteromonas sp. GutCa3]PKG68668.1 hypothetical protein CXF64_20315 [Pseudoalteromonas sp. GutCa3]